ncbi:ABC transporter ATP-binding protein [bacterium]|nr:ABC transporter ATP-binding protein [bacterium]
MDRPIEIKALSKSYGDTLAVDRVSITVDKGEIYGLIGPDGAGKTTVIRTLVSLLVPDSGEALFMGRTVSAYPGFVRSHIGYMPQRFSLYRDLSVEENLHFFGDLFQIPRDRQRRRMDELYAFSRLQPFRTRLAGALSGGMKQKLALSCMLMHQPEVIVLDEPTFGVDPVSRSEFWGMLAALSRDGTSVFVSTAYMDEADLCHRIGLIHHGRILAQGTPDGLIAGFPWPLYRIDCENPHHVYTILSSTLPPDQLQLFGSGVYVVDRGKNGLRSLQRTLRTAKIACRGISSADATLENLFLELIR